MLDLRRGLQRSSSRKKSGKAMLKDQAIIWSERLRLPRLTVGSRDQQLTTIVFHHFRFGDETLATARERLTRQCAFLAEAFTTVDPAIASQVVGGRADQLKRPLLVTIDDAKRGLLDVIDIFESFDIPLAQFVCAGWSDLSDNTRDSACLVIRLVVSLHRYGGPDRNVPFAGSTYRVSAGGNPLLIDAVIEAYEEERQSDIKELIEFEEPLGSSADVCDWSELRDLKARGVTIGCHSVSHPMIGMHSNRRKRFEIQAARALIEQQLGSCQYFAYPFGIRGSHDDATLEILRACGFAMAFTTEPALARPGCDPHLIPRIVLPEHAMSDAAFKARVLGGGIPLARLKEHFA